ncbi:mannitol dehydrogenase family protein [Sphingomonas sp. SUN039]|uniref:mannitol dehydrogenase family protein n=1 Tax=Sphingomonas sp. SUN039 TaxID=2937787 RepID=UPI0021649E44|nr:mannitol dehydrogenase family protein [Sphingomonas sp. SUN039]UVO53389.1 mannitol dehydrogenase family protein [Sphingomonas sp. SUN039]
MTVGRPTYDRAAQAAGIVHFGIGAFHRAHQAVYTDAAMNAGDVDWGIVGVSLRSANVAEQMNPQDGLYTVAARSSDGVATRLIGAVQTVLVAADNPSDVAEAVAAPSTRIVSFTITEKGYCRGRDGRLDAEVATGTSVYRYMRDGLALRRARGLSGLTLLSCDNLANNGAQLQALLGQYLAQHDPALADWVRANCTFPSSMVDRIVPATTPADLDAARLALGGLHDAAHVVTEPFSQWVIEDQFAEGRPRWEVADATFVDDVAPYETAKLRMLNGAHSALAYLGLKAGYDFVHEAIADARLRATVGTIMRTEAAPTIDAAPGQDLTAYADQLIDRFANPALNHRLIQIAMDGSQKVPQRWLDTLAWHQERASCCPAILEAVAAWIDHLAGRNRRWGRVDDPLADALQPLCVDGTARSIARLFEKSGPLGSPWQPSIADCDRLLELVST